MIAAAAPLPVLIAALGGLLGAVGGLSAFFYIRSTNAKLQAEAVKLRAEAASQESDATLRMVAATQARYEALFDDLQTEVTRLRSNERQCQADLTATIAKLSTTNLRLLDVETASSAARATVVELQDRLDRLEDKTPAARRRPPSRSTVDAVKRAIGAERE